LKVLLFAMRFAPEQVGTALYASTLAAGLTERGLEVTVLSPSYGSAGGGEEDLGYRVWRWAGPRQAYWVWRYPPARRGLACALDELQPDVIWATNGMATRVAGTMIPRLRMSVIGTIYGTDIHKRFPGRTPRTWIESIPQRRFYDRADALLTISRNTFDLAMASRIDPEKMQVVYLGVDSPPGAAERWRGARARHPDLAAARLVLTVGRLVPQKGHRLLIEAMDRVMRTRPDIRHVIVGDGPEREALATQIRSLRREETIRLVGRQEQEVLEDFFALSRLFALTSHATHSFVEGLGYVFLEAAVRGVPSVGTRHGGIPEVIRHGETGYLVDPDPRAIADRLGAALDDEASCRRLGDAARARAERYFTTARMVEECHGVLMRVAGRG
jgi:glycosyltransferase involved in cell wall biosynthesis